ncbi:hypothetical protein M3Y96_00222100 [Aphelenchoides besseyi]|nr:hypothetical protein M3Y96_00222100 [Aphelenchoides besseyi]
MGSAGRANQHDLPANRTRYPNVNEAPDRISHESNLRQINTALARVRLSMKNYWSDAKRTEIRQLQDETLLLQEEFNSCSVDEQARQLGLSEQLKRQTLKQSELHEIEDADLTYRSLAVAQQRLADVQNKYERHSFSIREEKILIAEISRIKRNISKLPKYLSLLNDKRQLDVVIKDTRQELRTIRSKMRNIQDQIRNAKRKIRKMHEPYVQMKVQMHHLHAQKHQIVYQYEQKRQEFQEALRAKPAQHPVATCPVGNLQDDNFDQYEPFCEQKMVCSRLLRYLRKLKQNCEPEPVDESIGRNDSGGSSSDSADEFPESFKLLSMAPKAVVVTARTNKRKFVKKYVKKTVPITHGIDHINMFSQIDVDIPKTYGEIDEAIEAVEKVQTYFTEQTEIENLNFDRDDDSPSLILSTSTSEFNDSQLPSPCSGSS